MTNPVIMADSTNPDAIPASWRGPVAGYSTAKVPGIEWPAAAWQRFERNGYIKIATLAGKPDQPGRCLDVEKFDANPDDALPFLRVHEARGRHDGTIYASLDTWPEVMANVGHFPLRLFVAWYWERPGPPPYATVLHELAIHGVSLAPGQVLWACQYLPDHHLTSSGVVDLSVVYPPDNLPHDFNHSGK